MALRYWWQAMPRVSRQNAYSSTMMRDCGIRCARGGQPYPFIGDVGTGNIFTEPVAQHKPDVRLNDILLELDRDANANAISLCNSTQKFACGPIDPDAPHSCFPITVTMIDVR